MVSGAGGFQHFARLWLLGAGIAAAFPPAPYYTLFGIVRDQVGQTITAEGAEVVLLKGTKEMARTPVTSSQIDQSYELKIRIDQARSGTTIYSDRALAASGLFSLAVSMKYPVTKIETWYYPIEVSGNLTAGKGGERVRLDLTLGEDSDGDGLPDAWEEYQLYYADYDYENRALIDKDGDFDKDGQSNWFEYVAGTFATDARQTFNLSIKEKHADRVRFEFYGVTGKTYTIESTLDMRTWTRIDFAVSAPGIGDKFYLATRVGVLSAFAVPRSSSMEFYRLTVQ
jgi:hypothetical protein